MLTKSLIEQIKKQEDSLVGLKIKFRTRDRTCYSGTITGMVQFPKYGSSEQILLEVSNKSFHTQPYGTTPRAEYPIRNICIELPDSDNPEGEVLLQYDTNNMLGFIPITIDIVEL